MDQATALYNSIAGFASIRELVTDRRKEDIYLEFKTKKNRSLPDLEDSDAWQFSRALSGFANSDGGVLVWGIETDKEERAHKLKPITAVSEFEARLKKSLINSAQPFVDGVCMEPFMESEEPGSGYLKILIPRSEKTPHRALLAGREYYKRSTEGFYRMEHFDLEDAFGRRPQPVLTAEVSLVPRLGEDPHEEVSFRLKNIGRGIARFAGLFCEFSPDVQIVRVTQGLQNNSGLNQGRPIVSYQDNVGAIHPVSIARSIGSATVRRTAKGTPLAVALQWYCEGMIAKSFEGNVPPETSAGSGAC